MPWLVSIVNKPVPERRPASPQVQARKDELLRLWSKHIEPVEEGGEGDYEDFYEQAVRLEAALDAFGAENVWLIISTDRHTAVNAGTGERLPTADVEHFDRYGVQASRRHEDVDMEQARLAGAYHGYQAFLDRAGRRIDLCGLTPSDRSARDLGGVLAGYAGDGIDRAFIKATQIKYAAFAADLPAGFQPVDAAALVYGALGYGAMSLEYGRDNLIAQEFVAMEYEYRCFVVGHNLVTAAGCIEEFTPLDNNGFRYDNQLRRNRQERTPVEPEAAIAGILTGFARDAVDALALEVPALRDYVIDVALGPDGKPLIVELNSLLNSGLYASRPELVARALAVGARAATL
jgi:hypothetical protein